MKEIKCLLFIFISSVAVAQKQDSLKIIAEKQIKEVVITGKKPVLETKPDRFVFNVENTGLVIGNNAWNVLEQTPLLMVDEGSGISVMGFQNAVVYINGRKSILLGKDLYSYLKAMPADNLVKIDIITTPSAKYDANDGAVIDLILKKLEDDGWKGSVSLIDAQARKNSQTFNSFLSYHHNRYSQSTTFHLGEDRELVYEYNRNVYYDSPAIQHIDVKRNEKEFGVGGNTAIEYEIDDNNLIGGVLELNYATPKSHLYSSNYSDLDNSYSDLYRSVQNYEIQNMLFSNNLFYKYFDEKKQNRSLEINWDYVFLKNENNGNYQSFVLPEIWENANTTFSKEQRKNYSLKADYSQSIGESGYNIEVGFKNNSLHLNNPYEFNSWNGNDFLLNNGLSNNYRYTENIFGSYLVLSKIYFKKLNIKAGLRAEFTNINAKQDIASGDQSNSYNNWLPTINVNYKINDKNNFTIAYRKSIVRPYANELNPFVSFINDNFSQTGNTNLLPSTVNAIRITYTLNKFYTFTGRYKTTSNLINYSIFEDDGNYIKKPINLDGMLKDYYFGLSMYRSFFKNMFTINASAGITYFDNSEIEEKSGIKLKRQPFHNAQFQIDYNNMFKTGINTTLAVIYTAKSNYVNYSIDDFSCKTKLSFSKKFEKQNLNVRLDIRDPFNYYIWNRTYYSKIGYNTLDTKESYRSITLSLSKTFGNKKSKETKKKDSDKGRIEEGSNTL